MSTIIHSLLKISARLLVSGGIAVVIFSGISAYAQEALEPRLTLSPAYPKPEATVTVSLDTTGMSIAGGAIRWFVDGKEIPEAANGRTILISAGPLGSRTVVEAHFGTSDGTSKTFSTEITPSDIDIVVEPDTYKPPFYEGRALPTAGASLRLVAVPHLSVNGTRIASTNVIYTWRQNGTTLFQGPRLGQDSAVIDMPMAGQATITVRAEARDGSHAAESSITLRSADPIIQLYEDDPLYGTIPLSPATILVPKEEVTLRAEPYYFNRRSLAQLSTTYSWTIDRRSIVNPSSDQRSITLRQSGNATNADVGLAIRSTEGIFQLARTSLGIEFIGTDFNLR